MSLPIHHLYIHVPFCAKICPYCAFYVEVGGASRQAELVEALALELDHAQKELRLDFNTIFLGGGTPSLLNAELFRKLSTCLPALPPEGEFTLEVNPATVTEAKALAWREAGVSRISLGAQSFDSDLLKLLGRQHAPEDIGETCSLLRRHGHDNINIDLMFGLPGQSLLQWETTLRAALECAPYHVSAYALTYEHDTPFFEQLQLGTHERDEEVEIAMFELTRSVLKEGGLVDYEVSNFSKPGGESRHNLAYWRGADYLGLGPSAVSTVTKNSGSIRWKNVPDTRAYVSACQAGQFETLQTEIENLDESTRSKERLFLGLRMREGVPASEFALYASKLEMLVRHGLATRNGSYVQLTLKGQLVADTIAAEFL